MTSRLGFAEKKMEKEISKADFKNAYDELKIRWADEIEHDDQGW